ncbi:hypothetical protein ACFPRL_30405 [Pseudoclavibacter helvolus]
MAGTSRGRARRFGGEDVASELPAHRGVHRRRRHPHQRQAGQRPGARADRVLLRPEPRLPRRTSRCHQRRRRPRPHESAGNAGPRPQLLHRRLLGRRVTLTFPNTHLSPPAEVAFLI